MYNTAEKPVEVKQENPKKEEKAVIPKVVVKTTKGASNEPCRADLYVSVERDPEIQVFFYVKIKIWFLLFKYTCIARLFAYTTE